jgi:hypothetical protein
MPSMLRMLGLQIAFGYRSSVLAGYSQVLFTGGNPLEALAHVSTGARTYFYCHSLPRHLFEPDRSAYRARLPLVLRFVFDIISSHMRKSYLGKLGQIHEVIANSHHVKNKLQALGIKVHKVIHPCVQDIFSTNDSHISKSLQAKDSYLSPARNATLK